MKATTIYWTVGIIIVLAGVGYFTNWFGMGKKSTTTPGIGNDGSTTSKGAFGGTIFATTPVVTTPIITTSGSDCNCTITDSLGREIKISGPCADIKAYCGTQYPYYTYSYPFTTLFRSFRRGGHHHGGHGGTGTGGTGTGGTGTGGTGTGGTGTV